MSLLAVSISVNSILYAVLIVGGVGLFIGIALGIAGKFLSVEVDEKEVAIREALPGNNCGGCGYPGCDGLAAAIASGESEPSASRGSVLCWAFPASLLIQRQKDDPRFRSLDHTYLILL